MSAEISTHQVSHKNKSASLWAAYLVALVLYAWAYGYFGAFLILGANVERSTHPQMDFIEAVYRSAPPGASARPRSIMGDIGQALPHYTDGTVDPLLPWLMSSYSSSSPEEIFEAGKWLNFTLSGCLLLAFAVAAAQAFSFSGAAAMILMGGFGVILERSGYFSSDALYFLIVALAWLCALSLIRQNPLWLYGVFGFLLGFAYLAKSMIWPIVVGFVLVSALRSVWLILYPRRDQMGRDRVEDYDGWSPANQFVGFAVAIAAFLLVAGPRLSYAATMYGDPFHSDLKYAVWCDSPEEAELFRRDYPDKTALDSIPLEEKPGIVRFVQQHGASALAERGLSGAYAQVKSSILGRSGWILVYGFLVFLVVAVIHRRASFHQDEEVWRVRGANAWWMLLFLVSVGVITLFYAGIGNTIIPHNAMTTSLFLPILITFIWIAERYRRHLQRTSFATLVNRVYVAMMGVAILWITTRVILSIQSPVA